MNRRRVLEGTAAATIGTVAGCITSSETSDEENSDTQDDDDQDDSADVLQVGEWYRGETHHVRVDSIDTSREFETKWEEDTYQMPDGEQLVFVDFAAETVADDHSLAPVQIQFDIGVGDDRLDPIGSFEGPETCFQNECDEQTNIDWLDRPGNRLSRLEELETGERNEFWFATVSDDEFESADITVYYSDDRSSETVSWTV